MAHVGAESKSSASQSPVKSASPRMNTGVPNVPGGDPYAVVWNGIVYKAGMCLEFKDGSFMQVTDIEPQSHELGFYGRRLFRSTDRRLDTCLPKLYNELVWMTQLTDDVSSNKIKRIVNIRFTNHRTHFRQDAPILTCRLKLTMRQAGVIIMWGNAPLTADDNSIEYLEHNEADPGLAKWSKELRDEWRGTAAPFATVPFGEAEKSSKTLEDEHKGHIDLDPERAYTFGDAYCGGGGVSCGAKKAGVKIKWATDMDKHALDTYQLNFEDVEIERAMFSDFLTNTAAFLRVDVAHCSPPCQTWSPAHTVKSTNDDANSACVFSGFDLALATRCRVLTIEETSGLLNRFVLHFNRIVLSLVELGYAVRWSILGCDNYGVPQERKRVMIIAAG
jgi:DNA (cytosine-5)-methyltransferase 1